MKLLFDHNLSPRLVNLLSDIHPNFQHIFTLKMDQANDQAMWNYATENGFTIVTRDSDFNDISLIRGFPPKVVWIRRGNCSTQAIEQILRSAADVIQQFTKDSSIGVLRLH